GGTPRPTASRSRYGSAPSYRAHSSCQGAERSRSVPRTRGGTNAEAQPGNRPEGRERGGRFRSGPRGRLHPPAPGGRRGQGRQEGPVLALDLRHPRGPRVRGPEVLDEHQPLRGRVLQAEGDEIG